MKQPRNPSRPNLALGEHKPERMRNICHHRERTRNQRFVPRSRFSTMVSVLLCESPSCGEITFVQPRLHRLVINRNCSSIYLPGSCPDCIMAAFCSWNLIPKRSLPLRYLSTQRMTQPSSREIRDLVVKSLTQSSKHR